MKPIEVSILVLRYQSLKLISLTPFKVSQYTCIELTLSYGEVHALLTSNLQVTKNFMCNLFFRSQVPLYITDCLAKGFKLICKCLIFYCSPFLNKMQPLFFRFGQNHSRRCTFVHFKTAGLRLTGHFSFKEVAIIDPKNFQTI